MNVEAYRYENQIFCIVFENCSEEDILLNEEDIRSVALEEAKTQKEEDIILNSNFIILPRDEGGFCVEFEGFFE